ncbi:MAG TPA: ribosome maturation factor RimM [Candidatus Acidoferrales bacterium]|nr:ribosome maturation factor RimM [Candidatus Acidoferrales bacterium]
MIRVGLVTGPFGVEGAVKVETLTDFADRFEPGATLELAGQTRRVEWSRPQGAGLVVKLAGIDSRTLAELHRGRYLEVAEARPLPAGSFYPHQLVGLQVLTQSGRPLGRLADVLRRPANDVWVADQDGVEHLVPATKEAVKEVDLAAGRVVVADWLLEVEDV